VKVNQSLDGLSLEKEDAMRVLSFSQVAVSCIDANPFQPRRCFKDSTLSALVKNIKKHGIIQPLVVKQTVEDRYVLIAGERRLRAAKLAGLYEVPVSIYSRVSDRDMLSIALIENIQRDDLNVLEEASAYKTLVDEFGMTHLECAQKAGKDRATISNILRLLSLSAVVRQDLTEGVLSMGHGKALLSLEGEKEQLFAREQIVKKGLNVRQAEKLCQKIKGSSLEGSIQEATNLNFEYLTERLRANLQTKVKLSGKPQRGKIEISFFSANELERLIEQLSQSSSTDGDFMLRHKG